MSHQLVAQVLSELGEVYHCNGQPDMAIFVFSQVLGIEREYIANGELIKGAWLCRILRESFVSRIIHQTTLHAKEGVTIDVTEYEKAVELCDSLSEAFRSGEYQTVVRECDSLCGLFQPGTTLENVETGKC